MLKIKSVLLIGLILLLALGSAPQNVFAAPEALSYQSGVQVVNLSSSVANITIQYYNQSDGSAAGSATDTIAVGASKTYFPITGVSAGFNGSAVISSDQQVAAIVNTVTNDFMYGDSSNSFSAGNATFQLPLIECNNGGFNTYFSVQNAGTSDAHITITYKPATSGKTGVTETATIKPGASKTFDQTTGSATKNCTQLAGSNGKFLGGASISSDQPVVASVFQLNTTTFKILMAYNGFPKGSTTVSLPLVEANNSTYYTGIQVQNVGSSTTNVTITYAPNTAGTFTPAADHCNNLAAGASCTLIQSGGQWTGKYVGSAKVTNSASQQIVAIVNQVSNGYSGLGPFGSSYTGFDPAAATSKAIMPLIMANNSGYYTGFQVVNVGTSNCATITVDYGTNTAAGGTFNPANEVFSLAGGASKTIIQSGPKPGNGSVNNWATAGKYIGSASISAPGCTIAAIVNQANAGAGDKLFTYNAFNQ